MEIIDIVTIRRNKILKEYYDNLLNHFDFNNVLKITCQDIIKNDGFIYLVVAEIHYHKFLDLLRDKGFNVTPTSNKHIVEVRIDDLD